MLLICVVIGVHVGMKASAVEKRWMTPRFIAPPAAHVTYDLIGASQCRPTCPSRWPLLDPLLPPSLRGGCDPPLPPPFAARQVAQSRVALLVPWNEPTVAYRG